MKRIRVGVAAFLPPVIASCLALVVAPVSPASSAVTGGMKAAAEEAAVNVVGGISTDSITGNGSGITNIDGTNITSGIVGEPVIDPLLARDSEVALAMDQLEARLEARLGLGGSRLWLLPDWYQSTSLGFWSGVNAVYLGGASGTNVSCHWESIVTGSGFDLEQLNQWVPAGHMGFCNSQGLSAEVGFGWMVIESDEPIFAVGFRTREASSLTRERNVQMIPLDCSSPAGYEFVCAALAE